MHGLTTGLLVVAIVALVTDILCTILNRRVRSREMIAEAVATFRLLQREDGSLDVFSETMQMVAERETTRKYLVIISNALNVPVSKLKPGDRLLDLVRVYFDLRGKPIPTTSDSYIDAYAYGILEELQKGFSKDSWIDFLRTIGVPSVDEEQALSRILDCDLETIITAASKSRSKM